MSVAVIDRYGWQTAAACRGADPDLFYPDSPDYIPTEAAALCDTCPVREQCLDWALQREDFGIWGGIPEAGRRRLRRRLRVTRNQTARHMVGEESAS